MTPNPTWNTVLEECHQAGYDGIELGPVGFMPEDPGQLGDALAENSLELIGGVVFQPFHDSSVAKTIMSQARRTAHALVTHSAQHMVLIDSISEARAPFAGRPSEAITMAKATGRHSLVEYEMSQKWEPKNTVSLSASTLTRADT